MTHCFEHDYENTYCARCGGFTGMACTVCGDMTDGGEHNYVTQEWCECGSKQIIAFDGQENDMFCSIHQCETHLVDDEEGSHYECPQCKTEDGEALGRI